MSSIRPIIQDLEVIFDKANKRFFGNSLPTPVITVSPDITNSAYGWFTQWKAWEDSTGGYYEINMCAEYLNRPIEDVVGTLIHEMVHLFTQENNIQDTSRGSTYHNKRFKENAECRGLKVEKAEKYGWAITSLNDEGIDFVKTLDTKGFELHRTPIETSDNAKPKRKSSSRKYICPQCGQSIRATKEIKVLCGECTTEDNLVLMELEGDEE